jgi:AraC-like DNA-binding protein
MVQRPHLIELDSREFPEAEALDAYAAFHSYTMEASALENTALRCPLFGGSFVQAGTFVIGEDFNGAIVQRTLPEIRQKLLPDILLLRIYLEGADIGEVGETAADLKPGPLHVFPLDYTLMTPKTSRFIFCCVPFDQVGYDPSIHPEYLRIPQNAPMVRMFKTIVHEVLKYPKGLSSSEAAAVGDSLTAIVRTILQNPIGDEDLFTLHKKRAEAMRSFVIGNLCDPNLNAESVCQAFNVSRAVAYRAFQPDGGISAFIRRGRMGRARSDLMSASRNLVTISEVGQRWGFADAGHFSRAFRETFDVSPSDIIGLADFAHSKVGSLNNTRQKFSANINPLMPLYRPA